MDRCRDRYRHQGTDKSEERSANQRRNDGEARCDLDRVLHYPRVEEVVLHVAIDDVEGKHSVISGLGTYIWLLIFGVPDALLLALLVALLRALGPGLVTGDSDDDSCGIATYAQTGAQFSFGMLRVALITFPLMAGVQEICDRTALATGKGLGELMIERFGRMWRIFIGVLIGTLIIATRLTSLQTSLQTSLRLVRVCTSSMPARLRSGRC